MKKDALNLLLGTMQNHTSFVSDEGQGFTVQDVDWSDFDRTDDLTRCGPQNPDKDINYCADLYIQLELFEECWAHLQKYCGFGDRCDPTYTKYDFICAAGISLLALGEEEKANSYFDTFINDENNIDEYGDLWLHVCEHYLKLFTSWKSQQDISGQDIIFRLISKMV